jgi:release factor glutamine methyltransferase
MGPMVSETAVSDGRDLRSGQTIGGAVRRLALAFRQACLETPELDARILVAAGAGISRAALIASPEIVLEAEASQRIASYQARRLLREPVSRIIGWREFRGLVLELGAATLDPRPDTETVVETALDLVRQGAVPGGPALRVLDLGTGTGAILIAILAALPAARGVGTDIAPEALEIAQRNAQRHGVGERATFSCTDWSSGVAGIFDLVVSNPPYIATGSIAALQAEVAQHDPRLALDGGDDGLAAYRALLGGVRPVLNPAGWLLLEVSPEDAEAVLQLCHAHGFAADGEQPWLYKDLAGRPRCVAVRARPGLSSKKGLGILSHPR